jgi:hypothetical protein
MLQFKRPMGSRTEHNFRKYFIHSIKNSWEDDEGNIHVLIARKDKKWPKVMWSCHTDTVHTSEGYQRVRLRRGEVSLAKGDPSNCLGADCTIGVWLMREMIAAKVPGHYVFHWGEERGCIGSKAVTLKHPEYFRRAKAIIAFDRRDDTDIITHQRGRRTASDAFAKSLMPMLPKGYAPSSEGIYTDSAEYADLVSECTNLSVGYMGEHSSSETVDLKVTVKLLQRIIETFDEDKLTFARDPNVKEYKSYKTEGGYYGHHYPSQGKKGKWAGYDNRPASPSVTVMGPAVPAAVPASPKPLVKGYTSEKPILIQGKYHMIENGHLVELKDDEARLTEWLRRKDAEDERTLINARVYGREC